MRKLPQVIGRGLYQALSIPGSGDSTRWLDYRHDRTRVLAHTEGGGLTLRDSPEALLLEAELPSLPLSTRVVGWMVADRENSALAGRLIQQSCLKHGVQPRVLTLHSDRGAPMTSQCTAQLLADLGVTRSLSRPQVSDDNPFSEAQFKTLKYHPSFPGRFGDQGQAKTFCRSFFRWYNAEHRHGGISMLTPEQVHFGRADQVIAGRKSVLREAWAAHPERFVRGVPKTRPLPAGRLHQSSHPFPHRTGHCSLINPVECPIVVDRFREGIVLQCEETSPSYRERFVPGAFSLDPGTTRWLDYRDDQTTGSELIPREGGSPFGILPRLCSWRPNFHPYP